MEFLSALSTILVFCLYPSLAAYWGGDPTADPVLAQRGAVNTYLALIGSLLTGYYLHGLLGAAKTKASLVEAVRGASIAGGIAIGIVCNAKLSPDLSLLIGPSLRAQVLRFWDDISVSRVINATASCPLVALSRPASSECSGTLSLLSCLYLVSPI